MALTMSVKADRPNMRGVVQTSLDLVASATAAGTARRFVRSVLARWEVPIEAADSVELVVSELVTNAAWTDSAQPESSDSARPVDEVRLTLRRVVGGVLVEVADRRAGQPRPRRAQLMDEEGRGLLIVAVLAEEWEAVPIESDGHSGGRSCVH